MSKLSIYLLMLATLQLAPLAPALAAAVEADGTHPGVFVQNSVITTQIRAKLVQTNNYSLAHIQVTTENLGEVTLSGNVNTKEEAELAIALAWSTAGVTRVNSLLVIP